MKEQIFENPEKNPSENERKNFENLLDFIAKEYFGILDRIDSAEEKGVDLAAVAELLEVDFGKMKEYIDIKIPELLERINGILRSGEKVEVIEHNSLRDILGNSILTALGKIAWVVENFDSDDEKIKGRIGDKNSVTRRLVDEYIQKENETGVATYYIDELCRDGEKLKMEIGRKNGYLEKFADCFIDFESNGVRHKRYPTGGEKLPFFKFFSELEKGRRGEFGDKETALRELEKLKVKKFGRSKEEEIINKEAVRDLIEEFFE